MEDTTVPSLANILTPDDLSRRSQGSMGLDLTPYRQMIQSVLEDDGVGGLIDLGPEEHRRTEKGRLTRAAREAGRQLVWRKSGENQLKFVLAAPDGPVPGARARRQSVERQPDAISAKAPVSKPIRAERNGAAAATAAEPATPPRRGRPRKTS